MLRRNLILVVGSLFLLLPGLSEAYIGPGAGFAFLGSFFALLIAFSSALLTVVVWPVRFVIRRIRRRKLKQRSRVKRVIFLGLDGLDPNLLEQWMAAGELPNFSRLAAEGSFTRLHTTYPAISPVAWASFMTGVDPSRHNIFDFLNRDLRTYKPMLSSSDVQGPPRTLRVGNWIIPLSKPTVRNQRKSRAFWNILGDHGVACNILRVPLTFPPEKFAGVLLSAMCIPDLRGTQGSFTYYTTSEEKTGAVDDAPEHTGGFLRVVKLDNNEINSTLAGPVNTMHKHADPIEIPFSIRLEPERETCLLKIAGRKIRLREREYSSWIRVCFKPGLGVKIYGIVRFYVTSLGPDFGLYVTPINIDPGKPALPISWPGFYSVYLSKLIGEFATLGLAEDTWALNERVIDEEAFLLQTLDYHEEREKMFFNALSKSRSGLVGCVFDGTDRLQHMFFRYLDEKHPANEGKDITRFRHTILEMYKKADEMVGRVMAMLGPDEHFMVISDHGFQSFRHGVNINTWLLRNGLLALKDGASTSGEWFEDVDWDRTKAYAFGLGGIYINQKGREAQGIVEPGAETAEVKKEIVQKLSGLKDEEHDDIAINDIFDIDDIYTSGPYARNSAELVVGYNRGYRASWEGAVGRVTEDVITDNTKSWSGDHCIDPRLVPGVLLSNWPITDEEPSISDLAPTILDIFGVETPKHMTGRALQVQLPDRLQRNGASV